MKENARAMSEEAVQVKAEKDYSDYQRGLQGWMERHRPDLKNLRVHDLRVPEGSGHSNETVLFEVSWDGDSSSETARYVARVEPPDGGVFPEQSPACKISVELQHRMMDAIGRTGVAPISPLLPFENDTSILGQPFFVMEFVPGVTPKDLPRYSQEGFLVDASPSERERLVKSGIQAMAAIHTLDWRDAGLEWLDTSGTPSMGHQVEIYRNFARAELKGREHAVLFDALDWLDKHDPNAPVGVSWGDARTGNMIFEDFECRAVVDWEAASIAPCEADLGWWIMFDRQSFEQMGVERLEGIPTLEDQVAYYESCRGSKIAGDIHYWEVFAVARFCTIYIHLADRMVEAGLMPEENSMAVNNFVTDQLAGMIIN
jgi:aminoglycoside phosphotransferase (APT) family kinase protein